MKTPPIRSFFLALALATFALPGFAAEAVKLSNVANSITFRDGAGHRGNYGFNGGSYSSQMFDGNFTSGIYQNGVGCQLVVPTTHIVTDPDGQPYVTEVKVGHLGNSKYSLYYTTEEEPADILTYSQDPRTWTAIDGATGVQEAGTKTFNVNQVATAIMYVFDTAPSWTQAACEFEVWGYEYVPAVAVKMSNVGRSITFRDGAGHRGNYGFNGGSYSSQMFDGNFTSGIYQNGVGCQLVVPTTGLDDQGHDTGVAWYVTEVKVGHLGNSKYSLYYTTEEEPADILTYSQDPRTWTAIDGATGVQEAGTKTYNVNKNATAVMYVFDTAPSWTQAACEFEVWAMDPSSISCLHEHLDQAVWTVFKPATCTENAFEECNCPDCNERFEREVPLSKLGHDFFYTLTEPGTTTAYGSGYVECSRCDEFHIVFDGDIVDLTTLGGPPINGIVQYTDLTASSLGAEDGGIKLDYLMDNLWDNGWGHAYYFAECSSNEYVQFKFGTTIDLAKIEYSVINEYQTVYFSKYDPATGVETLLKTIPIVKDASDGALGYQRRTVTFTREAEGGEEPAPAPTSDPAPTADDSNASGITVDAIRMRIGDYVDPETGAVTAYRGYNYGAHDRHTIVCEVHPWGTIPGAGKVDSGAKPAFLFMQ